MYSSYQTRRVKAIHAFMFSCTSGSGPFIWKHAALSHPRVYGAFEVFSISGQAQGSVCLRLCHFGVVLQLLAGRAAVKALDFPEELHGCYAHTLRLPLPSHKLTMTLALLVYF